MKKRFFYILTSILSLGLIGSIVSCGPAEEGTDGLRLVMSKSRVNIDVAESIEFTVKLDGVKIEDGFSIINTTGGGYIPLEGTTFTPLRTGSYEFIASYQGDLSPVAKLEAYSEANPGGEFYKRSVAFKYTGAWCVACPNMTSAITAVQNQEKDRLIAMSFHYNDQLENDYFFQIYANYKSEPDGAFPYVYVDLDRDHQFGNSGAHASLLNAIADSRDNNPAGMGLKLTTSINESDLITVDFEGIVSRDNQYKLVVGLLLDGFKYSQTGASDPNYTQDHVFSHIFNDGNILGEDLGELKAGEKISNTYTYTFDYKSYFDNLGFGQTIEDCTIVAFVLNHRGDGVYTVNNATSCKLGESVDFEYEKI